MTPWSGIASFGRERKVLRCFRAWPVAETTRSW